MDMKKPYFVLIIEEKESGSGSRNFTGVGSGSVFILKEYLGSAGMNGYENFEEMPKRERYEKAFSDKAGAEFYRRFFILER